MLIVEKMQSATAIIEEFGFESVGQIIVDDRKVEILLHDNAEFLKAAPHFKEEPVKGGGNIAARLTAKVAGVSLVAYKHIYDMSDAS